MKEQLITFETAKLAKEKEFEIDKYLSIDNENPKNLNSNFNPRKYQPWYFDLTQSLLQKWLREKHNSFVEVGIHSPKNRSFTKKNLRYFVEVNYYGKNFNIEMDNNADFVKINIKTYEEALEKGLQKALKLIK